MSWLCILFALLVAPIVYAEDTADARLKVLYEERRWAELHDAIGKGKDNELYRGAVAVVFNQDPRRAENLLLSVIRSSPRSEESYQAYEWLSHLYLRFGQYHRLLRIMEKRWAGFPEKSDRKPEQDAMSGFRGLPDQVVELTHSAVLRHEKASIFVPLTINGSAAEYFFDTGAWVSCMSASEAKRLGLSVRDTAGTLGSMTNAAGFRSAVAKEAVIGKIHFRNVSFAVFPDTQEPWLTLAPGRRGLIGIPILVAFRTLRWTAGGALEIGGKQAALDVHKSNLIFDDDHLAVMIDVGGRKALGALDTGAESTDFYQTLAAQFPSLVESGKKGVTEVRGVGGVETYDSLTLPEFKFTVGGLETALRPAHVLLNRTARSYIGNFGIDLLMQGRGFRLDFGAMTLDLEANN